MEPLLFAGYPLGSSLGLIAAFEWLGQPYKVSRVKMPDDMVTSAYAEANGRQETPMLVTADGVLTETMAIALWLERRDHAHRVSFEAGSRQSDRLHQYMAFLNSSFTAAFSPLWAALEMQGVSDQVRDILRSLIPWRGSTSSASLKMTGRIFSRSEICSSHIRRSIALERPAASASRW